MKNFTACAISHIGLVRNNNEDNLLFCGEIRSEVNASIWKRGMTSCITPEIFAVCDGMGGMENGEEASLLAVQQMHQVDDMDIESVVKALNQANDMICSNGLGNGTTCVAAVVTENCIQVTNIGDSRAYLLQNGQLCQLSQDHTVYERKRNMGFTQEQLNRDPGAKHTLTQYLGIPSAEMKIEPFVSEPYTLEEGSVLLLCSDGLSGVVEDEAIAKVLGQSGTLEDKMQTLFELALSRGGNDNITMILIA